MKTFLKWAGGKQRQARYLIEAVQSIGDYRDYYEPCLGGGTLFFTLQPKRAYLSDTNEDLVRTYIAVRDQVESVIALLSAVPHDRETFEWLRDSNRDLFDDVQCAARFIYLVRSSFGGAYRVDKFGHCNSAYSASKWLVRADNLRECSRALQGAEITRSDCVGVINRTGEGDLVYCDPPYIGTTHRAYSAQGFGEADQIRLRDALLAAVHRGTHVIASNSIEARSIYSDPAFSARDIEVVRTCGGTGLRQKELLITAKGVK